MISGQYRGPIHLIRAVDERAIGSTEIWIDPASNITKRTKLPTTASLTTSAPLALVQTSYNQKARYLLIQQNMGAS